MLRGVGPVYINLLFSFETEGITMPRKRYSETAAKVCSYALKGGKEG